ncbi:hypothetical protein EDC04DRAFT_2887804 [Pisolithus marmoratus]|nr:hypothetical protein EDC04DRAFT_2887804 [Pisolithus marmoratus]
MASPPPNPDTRELPPGWIQQYNWEYRQWCDLSFSTTKCEPLSCNRFYVNTRERPPRSVWEHPLGPPQPNYDRSAGYAPPYQPPNNAPPPPGYGSYGGYGNAPLGGYPGGSYNPNPYPPENRGFFGRPSGYQQQPKKSGMGMGAMLAAGATGLLGGALIENAFENHEEHEREEAYDAGYDQGYDQANFDDGDYDFGGGGDW